MLVVAQIALSVVLAGAAGLLVRSYAALSHVPSGFKTDNTLTFHVGAAWDEDRTRIGQLQERLVQELQQLPGVRAAGFTNFFPATGATLRYQVRVEGLAGPETDGYLTVGERTITPGYLKALQVPLVAGEWCPEVRSGPSAQQTEVDPVDGPQQSFRTDARIAHVEVHMKVLNAEDLLLLGGDGQIGHYDTPPTAASAICGSSRATHSGVSSWK